MENNSKKKFYAVMLFCTAMEMGISNIPNKWINVRTIKFDNGTAALEAYANIPNPASQLIDAESEEELNKEIEIMKNNYQNEKWLEENLYPYL